MTFFSELAVAVVGGVITALILEIFGRRRTSRQTAQVMPSQSPPRRRKGIFGRLVFYTVALAGIFAAAIIGGRMVLQPDANKNARDYRRPAGDERRIDRFRPDRRDEPIRDRRF